MKKSYLHYLASHFGLFTHLGFQTRKLACRRLLQACIALSLLCIAVWFLPNTFWSRLSLGLAFPGLGFALLPTIPALLLWTGALSFMLGALFIWFATGNVIAPILAWILVAIIPALIPPTRQMLISDQSIIPILLSLVVFVALACFLIWLGGAVKPPSKPRIGHVNSWHAVEPFAGPKELTQDNLARTRFLLDRALQPLNNFNGFERKDQFQTGALRYQLQFAGYALAFVQHCSTPAFKGYMHQAQSNLIEKLRSPKVWSYWKQEALWGQFKVNANPICRDNIMFTGFTASQMALFAGATGDERFCNDAAFTLTTKNGRIFPANFKTMIDNLDRQHAESSLGLIACEPNWVFPLCNSIGLVGMKRQYSQSRPLEWSSYAERMEQMFRAEFKDRMGNFVTCRSSHLGFAMPHVGGAATKALPSFFLNASLPKLARENWELQRQEIFGHRDERLNVRLRKFWPIDIGNYKFTRISGLAATAATARELGDEHATAALLSKLDKLYPSTTENGRFHRKHASIWAHSMELIAHVGQVSSLQEIAISQPDFNAPHLKECPLDVAQVALAKRSESGLEIVLYPTAKENEVEITFAGLKVNSSWQLQCPKRAMRFKANQDGEISCTIPLFDRTELRLVPHFQLQSNS